MAIISNKIEVITTDAIASVPNRPASYHYFDAYEYDVKDGTLKGYRKKGDKQIFSEVKDKSGKVVDIVIAGTEPVYDAGFTFNASDIESWSEI